MYSCTLLCYYFHPLHRQYFAFPHHNRHGQHATHCSNCCRGCCWKAPLISKLSGHRDIKCCRVCLSISYRTQECLRRPKSENRIQQLDWCNQEYLLRDESHLGTEHRTMVSLSFSHRRKLGEAANSELVFCLPSRQSAVCASGGVAKLQPQRKLKLEGFTNLSRWKPNGK